jgi:O-antigen/teichoic acid export membrane protein
MRQDKIEGQGSLGGPSGLWGLPRRLLSNPLVRNGYALVLNAALTSILGFVFWILCARMVSKAELGMGAALISALFTLGGLAQLNIGNMLNRYLAISGNKAARLIALSYAVAGSIAAILAFTFIALSNQLAPSLSFLAQSPSTAFAFAAIVIVWTLFSLQDSVLSGLRKSVWVPLENSLYAIAKIGFLLLPGSFVILGSSVFTAWTLPLLIIVVATNLLVFLRFVPTLASQSGQRNTAVAFKDVLQFFGWDYIGTTATMLTYGAAKLIVLNIAGPSGLAIYHLAWTVAFSLYLVGFGMSTSLVAEGAVDEERVRTLTSDTLVHMLVVLLAGAILLTAAAPVIMAMFGNEYKVESVPLLRLLVLSSIPGCLISIYLAVARLKRHLTMLAIVQFALLLLLIALGIPLVHLWGATGMGIAWLSANVIVALGISVHIVATNGFAHGHEWLDSLRASWHREIGRIFNPRFHPSTDANKPAGDMQ